MPLFDFRYRGLQEFVFEGGKYALRNFVANDEIPPTDLFSKVDIWYMEMEYWAIVAENSDLSKYKEEINLLLLSFKICKPSFLFIKYRLCKEDTTLCSRLNDTMHYISPQEELITNDDLKVIDERFSNLLKMDAISHRTHNALYFMHRGLCSGEMIDTFVFLMMAIESLFSKEDPGGATKTICSRVSKFLGCKARCGDEDIKKLYTLRSKIVHGKVVVDDEIKGRLPTLYELEYVLRECMKKMLDERIYLKYGNDKEKEKYFDDL
jgi:hypothetical protein